MTTNRQFALAVHVLILLALPDAGCLNSEAMAGSAGANAVSVRRILSRCGTAGYVSSRPGAGGGSQLARDPAQITLADVWRVVYGDEPIVAAHPGDPDCEVGSRVEPMLRAVDERARRAVLDELATTTIADLAAQVPPRAGVGALA